MKSRVLTRFVIIAVITLAALYVVIGPRNVDNLRSYFVGGFQRTLADNINLGLDLKGGSHFVMQVQVQEYLRDVTVNATQSVSAAAKQAGISSQDAQAQIANGEYRIVLTANDAAKAREAMEKLNANVNPSGFEDFAASVNGNTVTWTLKRDAVTRLSEEAVAVAERTIANRVDAFGVGEVTLQRHGAPNQHQLLLQIPGVTDPERIKKNLTLESKLELSRVITTPQQVYNSEEEARAALGGVVPPNRAILPYVEPDEFEDLNAAPNAARPVRYMVVETPPAVQGSDLKGADAVPSRAGSDRYQIIFSLKPEPAKKFGQFTASHIGEPLAVVLDGRVESAPTIRGAISDSGEITGNFTRQQAEDLAKTLRSGALPAPIRFQEERTVGASLGADSIRAGVRASAAGLVFVIIFMVFYYRGSGINAVVALILNSILTLAALVVFDATLTLPGIAGLILTLGMAVDSNVLIFERIREELKAGKNVPTAIDQGFDRAFTTIIDTHVTTIVSALFLFVFGTGPIRGFAITLILGLVINLFTAVYVSRTIFMWLLERKSRGGRRVETLSI